jgi:hypothetical protein
MEKLIEEGHSSSCTKGRISGDITAKMFNIMNLNLLSEKVIDSTISKCLN